MRGAQIATQSIALAISATSAGAGDDRADAIAGQAEDLGEAVELDQRVAPVGLGEERVRRARLRQEVAIGLVEDQRDAALARQSDGSRR